MKKLKALLYGRAKQSIPLLAKLFGVNLLDKAATLKTLEKYRLFFEQGDEVTVPPATPTGLPIADSFNQSQVVSTSAIAVYRVSKPNKVKIYSYGGVKLQSDVLDMDFGSSLFIKAALKGDKRPVIKTDVCVVLWSHEWGNGYFDYTYFIYAKLLRIKSIMSEDQFKQAKIVYPLIGTAFEKELLKHAGVNEDQLIDSRKYNVQADDYYLGNNDSWYYANKRDVLAVRNTLLSIDAPTVNNERIYISRKSRRKLTNEAEIIKLLKEFNFTIINDEPRSVAHQISIYKDAQVIIGPHGASFTNITVCAPQTMLIELFPNNYYPDYFRYLATALNMRYFALFEDNIQESHYRNVDEDITIYPEKIRSALNHILG